MATDYFKFKQFTVWHGQCAMKVGTDGVLLGAWAPVEGARRILDVGTGSGVIALQMAQRAPGARILAVEIDPEAARQAAANVAASPWADRIEVVCTDFARLTTEEPFDLIVSNPPYFVNSLQNPDAQRAKARHSDSLPYDLLLERAAELLAPSGRFALIFPVEPLGDVLEAAAKHGLALDHLMRVFTKPGQCKRLMCSFLHKPLKEQLPQCKAEHLPTHQEEQLPAHQEEHLPAHQEEHLPAHQEEQICIQDAQGIYTAQYRTLTAPFYLHF